MLHTQTILTIYINKLIMKKYYSIIGTILLIFAIPSAKATPVIADGTYKISPYNALGRSLFVKNSSLKNGENIVSWTTNEVNAQYWQIKYDSSNSCYFLVNAYTEKAIHFQKPLAVGSDLRQYDADASRSSRWLIEQVEENPNYYYIIQASLLNGEKLYVEIGDREEESTILLSKKKTGTTRTSQMWKIETVNAHPNKLTLALRNEIMSKWKSRFYKPAKNVGYTLSDDGRLANASHWWQDAEIFEIILDAYEATGCSEYKDMFEKLYMNFIYENGKDWLYNRFNDDIAWMVLVCVRAHLLFGGQEYLTLAKSNYDKMYDRAYLSECGLLRRLEGNSEGDMTNSCINGPAEVAACYLAKATGDESYYEIAKNLYARQRVRLYNTSTGQVYDCVPCDGSKDVYAWASTYNQGTFLGASVMLYNRYKDEMYKQDALKTMEYTVKNLCNNDEIVNVCGNGEDHFDKPGFKGILMRYVRRFILDMEQPQYMEWMHKNAIHAFNNRNSQGISWTAWWSKSSEDFVYKEGNNETYYHNDPFGTSTIISTAFNAPIDESYIKKNAFETSETYKLSYIRGLFSNTDTADNNNYLYNVEDGFWVGYNNVYFDERNANSVDVRISNNSTDASSIEIRLDAPDGELVGVISIPNTEGKWVEVSTSITPISGKRNIYFVFKGRAQSLLFNSFRFSDGGNGIGESKNEISSNLSIYPNPANNEVHIEIPENGQIAVYTSNGTKLLTQVVEKGIENLDIFGYEAGIYIVCFESKELSKKGILIKK